MSLLYVILGPSGMMGSMFCCLCKKNGLSFLKIGRDMFNPIKDDIEKLNNYIKKEDLYNILILNFIGCIPQKKYSEEEYIKINQEFPYKLANFCQINKYNLIHLSTNCVFSGKKHKYLESDIPDPPEGDIYSLTKYKGEPKYGTVIRASIIGLELQENGGYGLLEWFLRNKQEKVYGWRGQIWNGVTTLELSNFILGMRVFPNKIIHIYSEDFLSKYDLLMLLKKIFKKDIEVESIDCKQKFFTLSSLYFTPRKKIEEQLKDLYEIKNYYLNN